MKDVLKSSICWLFFLLATGLSNMILAQNQQQVSLAMCYDSAYANYPLARQSRLIEKSWDLKLNNLSSQWLPQLSMNGQANYNSDVTSISIDLPMPEVNFPKAPHDQYKVTLDVNQTIWDGGYSRKEGKLETVSRDADLKQVIVDLYGVRERINKVYFLALILSSNQKISDLALSTLNQKIETTGSAVRNGILAPVNLQILEAEKLKAEQRLFEIMADRSAALEILSSLSGMEVAMKDSLIIPGMLVGTDMSGMNRPELELLDLQMQRMDLTREVLAVKTRPRVYAFGQAGYGKPGLNMLSTEWDTYWMVGAGLKWTLWDWNITKREKQVVSLQKEMLNNQKDNFSLQVNIQSASEMAAINKYAEAVKRDMQILELRKEILNTISSQLDNGLITSTDFIQELNAKLQAEINLHTDNLLLLQAQQNLLTARGLQK